MEGGYAYIDSSYPRRPGDVAKLSSIEFEATGEYGKVEQTASDERYLMMTIFRRAGYANVYAFLDAHVR